MKILLIAVDFFKYDKIIANELKKQGHDVFLTYDQPKRLAGEEYHLSKEKLENQNKDFQLKIVEKTKNIQFDRIIVIVGRYLLPETLQQLKEYHHDTRFLLYLWDDVARVENFGEVKKFYDRVFSFDDNDCLSYGFSFLPLFYSNDCKLKLGNKKKWDIFSNFSLHTDRFSIVSKIIQNYGNLLIEVKMFVLPRLFIKQIIAGKINDLTLDGRVSATPFGISKKRIVNFMHASKCILDMQAPSQNGLTMRTIESLGCGVKIITTNSNISKYDFYNPTNVLIIDRNDPKIDLNFMKSEYVPLSSELYNKYSIKNWIKNLLEEQSDSFIRK